MGVRMGVKNLIETQDKYPLYRTNQFRGAFSLIQFYYIKNDSDKSLRGCCRGESVLLYLRSFS